MTMDSAFDIPATGLPTGLGQPILEHGDIPHLVRHYQHGMLGQGSHPLPRGIKLVHPQKHCKHWMLMFVSGSKKANVIVQGSSFKLQSTLNALAAFGESPLYFTYTGTGGTYLFAYEVVNGKHVIKLCVDGLTAHHSARGAAAPYTVTGTPASRGLGTPRGLGAVFTSTPYKGLNPVSVTVGGTWAQVFPTDTAAIGTTGLGSAISNVLSTFQAANNNIAKGNSSSYTLQSDGFIYGAYYDTSSHPAHTPGELAGVSILRYNVSNGDMGICLNEAVASGGGGGGGGQPGQIVSVQITGPLPTYSGPWQQGVPTSSGLWWSTSTLQWTFVGNQPPTTVYPPGAQTSPGANQEIGTWVLIGNGIWGWYPPGGALGAAPASSYGIVVGPSGTYATWAQAGAAATNGSFSPPPPGAPPFMASTVGTWQQTAPAYYVYVPTTALATTNYDWLWLLLGVVVVGGVAYYALD